jgi:hypothetical protein
MSDPTSIALAASIAGVLINSGVVGWGVWSVRKIAKEEDEVVVKHISDKMREHDRDPMAHPNHHMTPIIQTLQLQITQSLTEMKGDIKALSSEVAGLRKAHDDAISRGLYVFQQDGEMERKGR